MLEYLGDTNEIKVMSFLNLSFAPKSTGCHTVAFKTLFSHQKIERKYLFRETFVSTGLNLSLYRAASTKKFDQATQTTGRGNSKKWRIF